LVVTEGGRVEFGVEAAVFFADLLAHERERPTPEPLPLPDFAQEYLRTVALENQVAAWRAMAAATETP
jgi:hypothetical protein